MIKLEGSESTGVFDLALGLPLHPLVVHAAVILIPMAALAAIAAAIRPAISRKFGPVIIGIAVIGQLSSFLAKSTGQEDVDHRTYSSWLHSFRPQKWLHRQAG